jgi:DNA-binding XRE family transcriptional regulator
MRRKDPQALKRARKRSGYTQRELAYLAKCSHAMIYLLEKEGPRGIDTCSEELAESICSRLHVDVEDLFERRASPGRRRVTTGKPETSHDAAVAG